MTAIAANFFIEVPPSVGQLSPALNFTKISKKWRRTVEQPPFLRLGDFQSDIVTTFYIGSWAQRVREDLISGLYPITQKAGRMRLLILPSVTQSVLQEGTAAVIAPETWSAVDESLIHGLNPNAIGG